MCQRQSSDVSLYDASLSDALDLLPAETGTPGKRKNDIKIQYHAHCPIIGIGMIDDYDESSG